MKTPATKQPSKINSIKPNETALSNYFNSQKNRDVDKIFTRKVDLDYIPGLDDELKIILPGKIILLDPFF